MSDPLMRAIVIARFGGPDVLELRDVPRPVPGLREVLVRVHAAALNRADIMQREGRYPAPPGAPADIPGLEFAGEVALAGPGAARWPVGARVFGIIGGGAYAEYLTVHEDAVAPVPSTLGWLAAASVPEAFITAHDALRQAEMRAGDLVLIHAVGSGVGLAAVQMVRAMGGIAIGTARQQGKLDAARALGMVSGVVVGPETAGFGAAIAEATGGGGVNVVLDLLGGAYTAASVGAMAARGRLMLIGALAGPRTDLPLQPVLRGRLTIKGTVLRARTIEEKIAATRAFEQEVVPLFERGALQTVIDSTFPLASAAAAHSRMESNETVGKVVLRVDS